MIAGSLQSPEAEVSRWPAVRDVLRRAADPALLDAALGRHAIDGDRLYLVLAEYDTRPPDAGRPETHREFFDVQLVLRGEERIGWAPLGASWIPDGGYDPARDLQLYAPGEGLSWLVASPGRFFLLGPGDVHLPGVAAIRPPRVRKMVGKIHRSLIGR